ncbi:DUF3093 domain-containing protein [Brevibacterium sp. RIT 803]|uniref:DUF3093 domain-containing protein n=1 Tax=Brevibacterium sp. RIT 803 TaxID=2810210 RepID=UPI00195047BB|nr:DUF3093 domain-containing protein [Brevibacterium sp. RIT 803]MBM6592253.1 DUF3093 domain-containing protein [Brevibacterium sp. RIT 803]
MATTQPETRVVYTEKLGPSIGMWILIVIAAASTALMVLPVWTAGTIILPVISFVLLAWWLRSLGISIIVTERQLFVGDAHIDRRYVTDATGYDSEDARTARGTGLDARAFLMLRPWAKCAVRIDIHDESDPTPYWLVSSKRPMELAAALKP